MEYCVETSLEEALVDMEDVDYYAEGYEGYLPDIGYLGCLIQEEYSDRTMIIDDSNGFNNPSRLAMI